MQTANDHKRAVFNGDCGIVEKTDPDEETLDVLLDSGERIRYTKMETSGLRFAYAMTVHKAQGSEYRGIVLGICREHYVMLQRNILYTGITRAKDKVVLIGSRASVNLAIRNNPANDRLTALKERIRDNLMTRHF